MTGSFTSKTSTGKVRDGPSVTKVDKVGQSHRITFPTAQSGSQLCTKNEVTIQTSSFHMDPDSRALTPNALVLTGLREPYKFQELIFALKRPSRIDCTTTGAVASSLGHKPVESVEVTASLIELV